MKKLISIFIAVLLISCCLSVTVSAKDVDFVIAEDLQSLSYDGVTYYRADTSMISMAYSSPAQQPQLSSQQQELLRGTTFYIESGKKVIDAEFFFRDGSTLSCGFVAEDFREQLHDYLTDDDTECFIDYYWNDYDRTLAAEAQFKGTPVTLNKRSLNKAETYPVYVNSGLWGFTIIKGTLLVIQDNFYYVCHQESNIYQPYSLDLYEVETLDCYEITDPELIADIEDAMGDYYNAAFGTENLLGIASFVFWTFIFAVVPAAILVLAVIFFIRGRGYYRLTWGVTAGFAVLSLIMYFVVIAALFLPA